MQNKTGNAASDRNVVLLEKAEYARMYLLGARNGEPSWWLWSLVNDHGRCALSFTGIAVDPDPRLRF